MFFIVVRTSRRRLPILPHPPVSISTHGLQLLLTHLREGMHFFSKSTCPHSLPGFPQPEGSGRAKMRGEYGSDYLGEGEGRCPRPGLKPQSVALGWPRSRATEQKPGSLVTPTCGRPPQHSQPRNQAAAKARAWACTGLPTTTCKIFYSSPAPHRSRLQPAT